MIKYLEKANPSLFAKYPYFFLPAVVIVGYTATFYLSLPYTVIFFIYGIIPMMDQIAKKDWVNPNLREMKELNEKFYKKELKPYMKDQAMIWSDLDKFVFKPEAVANSVREYNRMYE